MIRKRGSRSLCQARKTQNKAFRKRNYFSCNRKNPINPQRHPVLKRVRSSSIIIDYNRENNMVSRICFPSNYYPITFEKVGLLPVIFIVGHAWTDASSCSDWNDWRLVARQIEIWSQLLGVRTDSYGDAWVLLLVLIKHWRS